MSPKIQSVLSSPLLSSPLPVRERIKVRVRLQRAFSRTIQDSAPLLLCALTLSACGQQGAGLLEPTPKQIFTGTNTIFPSAPALSTERPNFCNAHARGD